MRRYKFTLMIFLALVLLFVWDRDTGARAASVAGYSLKEMALVIPPVFVLLGLLDIWVPRETMMKYMGEESGPKGVLLALVLGSAAAGPLYAAFPIASVFMKKGVKFTNVLVFIGAWSTTKIPMFVFELSALGAKFALTRLLVDIPGIIIIAHLLSTALSKEYVDEIYQESIASGT